MTKSSVFWAFLVGGVSGAVVALLYAPYSGRESRQLLQESGQKLKETALETMETARSSAQTKFQEVRGKAEDVLQKAQTQADVLTHEAKGFLQRSKEDIKDEFGEARRNAETRAKTEGRMNYEETAA